MTLRDIDGPAELRAGLALLTATHQMLDGSLTGPQYARLVDETTTEHWADTPQDAVRAVAYLGVRIASLFATATDTDIDVVLGFLGCELASLPDS
ncbi:hypothetical protein GTY65_19805 [Streptomyces sp. SID8379]|uniref:hypothetical protein n=1 Tax=unclassified Streptomyces TaxID=2593676 RepID=UPI000362DBD8|nr:MULTISPECIES: hypothetical protein [unclassified Streptomyces]MYW66280.1 hypothetical protein [Streptomyces sp. SID8379]